MIKGLWSFSARRRRRALMTAADAARDGGDPARAADLYADLVTHFPDSFGAWVQLGNMLKDQTRYEEAAAAYRGALALRADDGDLYLQMGHLAKLRGSLDEARENYERSVQLEGDGGHAARELASLTPLRVMPAYQDSDLTGGAAIVYRRLQVALAARPA